MWAQFSCVSSFRDLLDRTQRSAFHQIQLEERQLYRKLGTSRFGPQALAQSWASAGAPRQHSYGINRNGDIYA